MQKSELLQNLKERHDHMMSLVKKIQASGKENEIIDKKWFVKDSISHCIFYEDKMIDVLKKKTVEGNSFYKRSDDDRNEENFKATHNLSLQEIVKKANTIYKDLNKAIENLTQEEIDSKFPGMTRTVADFIAGQSFGHYDDHIPVLQKRFNVQ